MVILCDIRNYYDSQDVAILDKLETHLRETHSLDKRTYLCICRLRSRILPDTHAGGSHVSRLYQCTCKVARVPWMGDVETDLLS